MLRFSLVVNKFWDLVFFLATAFPLCIYLSFQFLFVDVVEMGKPNKQQQKRTYVHTKRNFTKRIRSNVYEMRNRMVCPHMQFQATTQNYEFAQNGSCSLALTSKIQMWVLFVWGLHNCIIQTQSIQILFFLLNSPYQSSFCWHLSCFGWYVLSACAKIQPYLYNTHLTVASNYGAWITIA